MSASDCALLAPVPLEHLIAGLDTCREYGKAAFGSRKGPLFEQLEFELKVKSCPVFIYASDNPKRSGPPQVTWQGIYCGWIKANDDGSYRGDIKYRPKSVHKYPGDLKGSWWGYWHVRDLCELKKQECRLIQTLYGKDRVKPFQKYFIPEGLYIIQNPL
jgi:hypothetical protein